MKKIASLFLLVCFAGCMRSENRSVAIPEIDSLAASGYRGTIVVSGYYYLHPEQDAIFQEPQPYGYHVLLQLAPILEKASITDWRARQKFMQPFDRQLVIVTGELKKGGLHVGGLVTEDPEDWTFVRVEKIELANKAAEPSRTTVTPPAGAGDRASGAPGSP